MTGVDRGDMTRGAADLMPALVEELKGLVRIPSVSSAGFPADPLFAAHDVIVDLLRGCGVASVESMRIEGKTSPVVVAQSPAPPGAPTVLLYTHYDVVPGGDESLWHTPPFEPVERDGAIYGRGTADSKANIMGIIGALRLYGGRPPVGVKVVIEGQEEVGSPFDVYPIGAPDMFRADAMIIADVGSVRAGTPTLTVALRGSAQVQVEIRTLAGDKHSGQYGGAAPDARLAMIRLLASLHDEAGDVSVPGLLRTEWSGATYTDEEFRELAEIVAGLPMLGSGGLGERIWFGPAVTVVGFDAPSASAPINAVAGHARATLNLRVHPKQPAAQAQQVLVEYLARQRPFGITPQVSAGEAGNGVAATLQGPGYDAARAALGAAWGGQTVLMAGGGSIPIVMALHEAVPQAELLMFGAIDSHANIHAPNERVLLDEMHKTVLANAMFFAEFADRWQETRA